MQLENFLLLQMAKYKTEDLVISSHCLQVGHMGQQKL